MIATKNITKIWSHWLCALIILEISSKYLLIKRSWTNFQIIKLMFDPCDTRKMNIWNTRCKCFCKILNLSSYGINCIFAMGPLIAHVALLLWLILIAYLPIMSCASVSVSMATKHMMNAHNLSASGKIPKMSRNKEHSLSFSTTAGP